MTDYFDDLISPIPCGDVLDKVEIKCEFQQKHQEWMKNYKIIYKGKGHWQNVSSLKQSLDISARLSNFNVLEINSDRYNLQLICFFLVHIQVEYLS